MLRSIIYSLVLLTFVVTPLSAKDMDHGSVNHKSATTEQSVELAVQSTCPVMGGDINKKIYADHSGERVYFCCPMCIDSFKKDPTKYLETMKEKGEKPMVIHEDDSDLDG